MAFKLTQKKKYSLFRELINNPLTFKYIGQENLIMDFLTDIWELYGMPSKTDDRFKHAYGEIHQHIVNNNDWTNEYLFVERLNLLENDETYKLFLENVLNPKYQNNEDVIKNIVNIINDTIKDIRYTCSIIGYSNKIGLPIYKIIELSQVKNNLLGFEQNSIPFNVIKDTNGRCDSFTAHSEPTEYPSFVVAYNSGWNDYGSRTLFYLFYYKSVNEKHEIGPLKILYKEEILTIDHIDNNFHNLSDNYCSLGQDYDYYLKLKQYLGDNFMRVLFALKDAAFFSSIQEKFENNSVFINSLIRENYQERLLREIKHIVFGADLKTLYQFEYNFKPCYSDASVPVKFKFERTGYLPNRIYALIGQNGTGKTQFITSLPLDLSNKKHELFTPAAPLFSKIIAVSYGAFDNFKVPKNTVEFNYIYCGLKNDEGQIISEIELEEKFSNSWNDIKRKSRIDIWINILSNFLDTAILNELIILDKDGVQTLNIDNLSIIRKKMSSGQTIMLYVISEIVANIRYDSLLLYDEPETHLHPNAISQLMNTIQELIFKFQSYCIITTHSPLIIRELLSKSVYIVDKNGDVPSVRNIEIESYGENLGVLNDIVFGNREIPKFYKNTISDLIDKGLSYEAIINLLESDQVPLSLSLKIYIKSLTYKR